MSAQMLTEWIEYYKIEPFGQLREDLRLAQLMAHMANLKRNPKVRPTAYTVEDFLSKAFGEHHEKMPGPRSLDDMLVAAFRSMGMVDIKTEEVEQAED